MDVFLTEGKYNGGYNSAEEVHKRLKTQGDLGDLRSFDTLHGIRPLFTLELNQNQSPIKISDLLSCRMCKRYSKLASFLLSYVLSL
jgi:hypothetical protein